MSCLIRDISNASRRAVEQLNAVGKMMEQGHPAQITVIASPGQLVRFWIKQRSRRIQPLKALRLQRVDHKWPCLPYLMLAKIITIMWDQVRIPSITAKVFRGDLSTSLSYSLLWFLFLMASLAFARFAVFNGLSTWWMLFCWSSFLSNKHSMFGLPTVWRTTSRDSVECCQRM